MAILSSDGKYVTVQKGDTLWGICKTYLGSGNKYQEIAKKNNISNPNLIYVNQKIYIDGSSGSSSSSSSKANSNKVTITAFGLLSTSDNTLFATWDWSKESTTENYQLAWEYCGEDGVWFIQTSSNSVNEHYYAESRQAQYNIPTGAYRVRFRVKPVAKDKENSNSSKKTKQWTAEWTDYKTYTVSNPLTVPSGLNVEIDENNKLDARIDNIDINATQIKFEIVKNDTSSYKTLTSNINKTFNYVSCSCTVDAGHEYKVRCKALKNNLQSEWSDFSANVRAMPSAPSSITECKAVERNSDGYAVYLKWGAVNSAETYDIEYTLTKEYFDSVGGDTTTVSTTDASTELTIYKLTTGGEYFFRVRATNEKGSSKWSGIVSVKLGEAPDKPTTWSSTTTCIVGEPLNLYWMHNAKDGSNQTKATIKINGTELPEIIYTEDNDDENNVNGVYSVDTSQYDEGTELKWQVKTAGVTGVYGEYSTERVVDINARPYLTLTVTDEFEIDENGNIILLPPEDGIMRTLESFPFYVKAIAGPNTQAPVSYHMTITANEMYETVDQLGNTKIISAGDQLYSKYFDINTPITVEFSANNLDLENGMEYTINCVVSMDSGLTAEANSSFNVSWIETQYMPNAEITINEDDCSAAIRPYCEEYKYDYWEVTGGSGSYSNAIKIPAETALLDAYTTSGEQVYIGTYPNINELYYCIQYVDQNGNSIEPRYLKVNYVSGSFAVTSQLLNSSQIGKVLTSTGEEVFIGRTGADTLIFYSIVEEATPVEDVTLSVYRREFDGGFTEIATNLVNTDNTFVVDPHPALDYARYRIVAKTIATGAVGYYDLPNLLVDGKAAIIQWDEEWTTFNNWSEDPLSQPAWSGSLLKLPYNIDVSYSNSPDVSHVKYIGRKHPVSYHGTHVGEAQSWNLSVPKDDEETIYALRRLQNWMGNAYVREPGGTGFWASVKVSFSETHCEVIIPVTIDITRVEGGI